MITKETAGKFRDLPTPFYYYDLDNLHSVCHTVKEGSEKTGIRVHYAIKANANPRLLNIIASYGFGADCVSFNEIRCAVTAGFKASEVVFAGVGKTDRDIADALDTGILCFNSESIQEIEVIDLIAGQKGKIANIALRINPYVEAHTHKYITTAVPESKFGLNTWELSEVLDRMMSLKNVMLTGIHFHIGSQITKMTVFQSLCARINELQEWFASRNVNLEIINVGGGLGIDYTDPEKPANFKEYFALIREFVKLRPGQQLHTEPGRSLIGQCGSLISKVLFIKKGSNTTFAIIDAGMNDLIRPALYQA